MDNFEIERKFLIKMPDERMLSSLPGCKRTEISQTYLKSETGISARVRRSVCDGVTVFTKTEKQRLTDLRRIELEREITAEEYRLALLQREEGTKDVEKVRYKIPDKGLIWEIDIFPFWDSQAYLEVELSSEEEAFTLPSYIKVIREVTADPRYINHALAREIPKED